MSIERQTIFLSVGQSTRLRLSHLASAGYLWHLESLPALLGAQILDDEPQPHIQDQEMIVGAAGHLFTLELTALREGRSEALLRLRRPWDAFDIAKELLVEVVCA